MARFHSFLQKKSFDYLSSYKNFSKNDHAALIQHNTARTNWELGMHDKWEKNAFYKKLCDCNYFVGARFQETVKPI